MAAKTQHAMARLRLIIKEYRPSFLRPTFMQPSQVGFPRGHLSTLDNPAKHQIVICCELFPFTFYWWTLSRGDRVAMARTNYKCIVAPMGCGFAVVNDRNGRPYIGSLLREPQGAGCI
jgi:hypothetical protein